LIEKVVEEEVEEVEEEEVEIEIEVSEEEVAEEDLEVEVEEVDTPKPLKEENKLPKKLPNEKVSSSNLKRLINDKIQ